jgi:hypothetical protein
VKNKLQILTGVLAMYVLSLPVILMFHSQTHNQNTVKTIKSDFEDVTVTVSSDCQVCNFYFDQELYVENSLAYKLDTLSYYFHQNTVEPIVVLPKKQHYLRGPPIV